MWIHITLNWITRRCIAIQLWCGSDSILYYNAAIVGSKPSARRDWPNSASARSIHEYSLYLCLVPRCNEVEGAFKLRTPLLLFFLKRLFNVLRGNPMGRIGQAWDSADIIEHSTFQFIALKLGIFCSPHYAERIQDGFYVYTDLNIRTVKAYAFQWQNDQTSAARDAKQRSRYRYIFSLKITQNRPASCWKTDLHHLLYR